MRLITFYLKQIEDYERSNDFYLSGLNGRSNKIKCIDDSIWLSRQTTLYLHHAVIYTCHQNNDLLFLLSCET